MKNAFLFHAGKKNESRKKKCNRCRNRARGKEKKKTSLSSVCLPYSYEKFILLFQNGIMYMQREKRRKKNEENGVYKK